MKCPNCDSDMTVTPMQTGARQCRCTNAPACKTYFVLPKLKPTPTPQPAQPKESEHAQPVETKPVEEPGSEPAPSTGPSPAPTGSRRPNWFKRSFPDF